MKLSSRQPRRQRKAAFEAHSFQRRRRMTVPLSRELRKRYGRRNVPLRKGDTVRILRGSYVGREERVARIDRRSYSVTLDNITLKTREQKLKPLPIKTTHLLAIRLNLSDGWRRRSLKISEDEATEEEEGIITEAPPVVVTPNETGTEEEPETSEKPAAVTEPEETKVPAAKPKARARAKRSESE